MVVKIPKKRGPKKKKNLFENGEITENTQNKEEETKVTPLQILETEPSKQHKKRGRKPKGGKIVENNTLINSNIKTKPNIILHLKCCLNDIFQKNNQNTENIKSYNFFNNNNLFSFENLNKNEEMLNDSKFYIINKKENKEQEETKTDDLHKEVSKKLKILEYNLHVNNISDKKSACFWCTYDFDNQVVYIPKFYLDDMYYVYGCFCSPECGCAYLMQENVDRAIKFERLCMLNHIYSKVYSYKKNIKPAPNPYYTLDKYYGNLNIQEYRSLLQNERLFLVVDKPLTRVMFELLEDNDEFIINKKIIPNNNYKIKKVTKKNNKNDILTENFGIS
jgi:hypothetical protein